jgi:excisionase family DNA binding protein
VSSQSQHMSIKEVAAELNISTMQAHNLVTKGRLPAIDVGKASRSYWRISREDFNKYLADERAKTAQRYGGGAA